MNNIENQIMQAIGYLKSRDFQSICNLLKERGVMAGDKSISSYVPELAEKGLIKQVIRDGVIRCSLNSNEDKDAPNDSGEIAMENLDKQIISAVEDLERCGLQKIHWNLVDQEKVYITSLNLSERLDSLCSKGFIYKNTCPYSPEYSPIPSKEKDDLMNILGDFSATRSMIRMMDHDNRPLSIPELAYKARQMNVVLYKPIPAPHFFDDNTFDHRLGKFK